MATVLAAGSGHAAAPDGYYTAAEGKSGADLLRALHGIVGPHQTISYAGLWKAYEKTDATPEGKPWCIYSEFPFASFVQSPGGRPGRIGSYLTREHSFPKDWWGGTRNAAYSDLFHVILGDAHVNGQKGVNPLGETDETGKVYGISKVGPAKEDLGYMGNVFEPADKYKGDFARNYLYVATAYLTGGGHLDCTRSPMIDPDGISFKSWARRLLLKWNREDPVSDRERARNDAVFALQKNRNPFIDHPEYADLIWGGPAPRDRLLGADPNYSLEMEKDGRPWTQNGKADDLFKILRAAGLDSVRIRLWTGDDGVNGLNYATDLARRAQQCGLNPYLVIFLSENWSDYVKQPVPKIWEKLSYEEKLKAVETYAERVTRHFSDHGVPVDYFEIGNEIDFGICGEYEPEWSKRVSTDYMKAAIWPREAAVIKAAEAGVRKVRPGAKFTLHLTQWWNPGYCGDFFKTMIGSGVTVDFAGLSFFPTSDLTKKNSLEVFLQKTQALYNVVRKPLFVCEYGYPSQATFGGQFAAWNRPVVGYALDEIGQAKWLRDFLAAIEKSGFIDGAFYWSPEWYASDMWSAFALFDAKGNPKPALRAFSSLPEAAPILTGGK
jgi:arabinogalactan endo-1,4-beta-galactosidase/endonuclease I